MPWAASCTATARYIHIYVHNNEMNLADVTAYDLYGAVIPVTASTGDGNDGGNDGDNDSGNDSGNDGGKCCPAGTSSNSACSASTSCANSVCVDDPWCCSTGWDHLCVGHCTRLACSDGATNPAPAPSDGTASNCIDGDTSTMCLS